jgi:DNA-binding MarR family transcriptional regulator
MRVAGLAAGAARNWEHRKIMATPGILTTWRDVLADAVRGEAPDLSMRQWAILLTVYLNPGPHTVRGLSRDLNVPKPAISRALDALSILGYVRRVRDEADRRIVLVQKTSEGAIYVDEFARIVEERTRGPAIGAALYG